MAQTRHKIVFTKRKKTRKMRGGFLSMFKSKPAAAPVAASRVDNQSTVSTSSVVKTSTSVAVVTTLGSIATGYLTPSTIVAVTGMVGTSIAATGGVVVVAALVIGAAILVLREKKKAYKGLILVMDELYLVIQKLNGIIEVSMHIADAYGFPVDIRDVKLAMDAILDKFDELLDPTTDYQDIQRNLSDFKKLRRTFNALEPQVSQELKDAAGTEDVDSTSPPTISLWTKTKNAVSSATSAVSKTFKKNIEFSASTFAHELNEAVAYLALYVGIFSSSFSTTYTTVVVQLLANGRTDELKTLQNKVFSDTKFYGMVEGAVVYPLLQSQKTYNTCMLKSSNDSSCGSTFVVAGESMRQNMVRIFNKENVVSGDLYGKMTNLKQTIESANVIETVDAANAFANNVKNAFDQDKAGITETPVQAPAPVNAPTSQTPGSPSVSETESTSSLNKPESMSVPVSRGSG